jgi:hypothetical protein
VGDGVGVEALRAEDRVQRGEAPLALALEGGGLEGGAEGGHAGEARVGLLHDPEVALGDHREEELLLGPEVVEDPGGGELDLGGDVGQRTVPVAALGEHGERGIDDRLAPLLPALRLAGELVSHGRSRSRW